MLAQPALPVGPPPAPPPQVDSQYEAVRAEFLRRGAYFLRSEEERDKVGAWYGWMAALAPRCGWMVAPAPLAEPRRAHGAQQGAGNGTLPRQQPRSTWVPASA